MEEGRRTIKLMLMRVLFQKRGKLLPSLIYQTVLQEEFPFESGEKSNYFIYLFIFSMVGGNHERLGLDGALSNLL